ncbi:MAG: energy transducer TonB [Parabacteroides merdae]
MPWRTGCSAEILATNVRYPESAVKNGIEGRVSCSFVVGKDGAISRQK